MKVRAKSWMPRFTFDSYGGCRVNHKCLSSECTTAMVLAPAVGVMCRSTIGCLVIPMIFIDILWCNVVSVDGR